MHRNNLFIDLNIPYIWVRCKKFRYIFHSGLLFFVGKYPTRCFYVSLMIPILHFIYPNAILCIPRTQICNILKKNHIKIGFVYCNLEKYTAKKSASGKQIMFVSVRIRFIILKYLVLYETLVLDD